MSFASALNNAREMSLQKICTPILNKYLSMEQNNNIEFEIISGDDVLIKEVINNFNKTYNTDFEKVKFIYDEVVFARIKVSKFKLSDIFDLGSQLGGYAQHNRQKGEIDW